MKNLIKNRRGIAVEMAVVVMLIFVALSIVLMSISEMQVDHRVSDLSDFDRKTELYEITDFILENHQSIDTSSTYEIKDGNGEDAVVIRTYHIKKEEKSANNETGGQSVTKETTYTVTLNGENAVEETVLVIKITDGKISSWED